MALDEDQILRELKEINSGKRPRRDPNEDCFINVTCESCWKPFTFNAKGFNLCCGIYCQKCKDNWDTIKATKELGMWPK